MNALREQLRGRDPYYLQALLKNGDSDDPLVRAAYAELAMRGQVPEYAEGLFDSPAGDMPDNLAASATPISVEPDLRDRGYGTRVVGPRTGLGNKPVPGAPFQSAREAAQYEERSIDPQTGEVVASGQDRDMLERGFRPVNAEDGSVSYRLAGDTEGMSQGYDGAGTLHRMKIDNLIRPDAAAGFPEGRYRVDHRPGPLGASTTVLVPTQAVYDRTQARNERASVARFSQRTGVDFETASKMTPDERRDRLAAHRADDMRGREGRMRAEREFAGGSHNINSGNAMAIRQLVAMDPTRREELMADNMGPRNVQYRFNPRTGQVEFGSQRAYPPSENADARSLEMMMRENARRELVNQQREQSLIPLRAEVQRLASADGWGNAGLPRAEARRRLIASGLYPADLIDLALDEAYGRGAPDAATIPEGVVPDSPVDPTPSLVPMPGPDGAGTGMPYNYRY
jgi:hypothetical protein